MYSAVVVQEVLQKRWELWRWGAQRLAIKADNDQLRTIIEAAPLTTAREAAKDLNVDHCVVVRHLKQIGKVKKTGKWVPYELTENQNHRSEVSFSYCTQQQHTISRSDCDMWQNVDFIWQPAMTSSVAGPRSSRAIPKAKLAPKQVMVTVLSSAARLIHYSFPNPG